MDDTQKSESMDVDVVAVSSTTQKSQSLFMDWKEVAEILGYKKTKTCTIIKKANDELKEMGLPYRPGKMRRDYFERKYRTFYGNAG